MVTGEDWVTCFGLFLYAELHPQLLACLLAKSLQLCPILCDPIDGNPPGSPVPGILQARTLEWVAISFSSAWKWKVKVKSLSHVRLLATPWTAAHHAPPSMGLSRQEYKKHQIKTKDLVMMRTCHSVSRDGSLWKHEMLIWPRLLRTGFFLWIQLHKNVSGVDHLDLFSSYASLRKKNAGYSAWKLTSMNCQQ